MKTPFALTAFVLFTSLAVNAQYKAPSQYFPKSRPIPGTPGGTPSTPSTPANPATAAVTKFKDLSVNTSFYFKADTNRMYSWTKVTATTAKNNKSGVTQAINGEVPIQQ